MVNYNFFSWLLIAAMFFVLELGHPGLFLFLSFCCGSVCAAFACLVHYSFVSQVGIMMLGSSITFAILYWWLKSRKQLTIGHEPKMNVYALQGKRGLVMKTITPTTLGEIRVGTEVWSARSLHHDLILAGNLIEVVQVVGCHCIVKRFE